MRPRSGRPSSFIAIESASMGSSERSGRGGAGETTRADRQSERPAKAPSAPRRSREDTVPHERSARASQARAFLRSFTRPQRAAKASYIPRTRAISPATRASPAPGSASRS